ncbi:hypothetical protein CAPTEDRAFT_195376 [Capitella teleta]|uniref:Protein SZT2 n=1 Tax=Capitella teleta TaxID=283909 RepID=R7T5A2_CAPTE|nr:hypothetical protein CAPTEDRAFT_195376 [Capitella teleta]|eukprot:ELT88146.1 hypothetical protein CAPTEDRAFT_195376 [Capitella teleta]
MALPQHHALIYRDVFLHAEARDIYLLMPTVYYISRNERAQWFVDRLNGVVNIPCGDKQSSPVKNGNSEDVPQEECEHQEIEVLSVVPSVTSPIHESKSAQFRITPETQVVFLAPRYKLAFILDMSPTVANIDIASAGVLYDKIITALTSTMKETIATLLIPGSTTPFSPVIFITIIAHTSLVNCRKNQVLIQGCVLTRDNVDSILERVQHQLRRFESCVASSLAEVVDTKTLEEEDDDEQHLTGGLFEDIVEPPVTPDPAMYLTTPEASFVNMMRYGILALQMLPENSNGGIIVLTDGIVGMPDANMFESLMARLRHANISCSFVQLSASKSLGGLGQVPYPDLMKFIATATFGAYFSQPPKCDPDCGMNKCHHAFLTWSFRKGLSSYTFGDQVNNVEMSQDLIWTDRVPAFAGSDKLQWTPKLMRKKLTERTLHLPMPVVLSCRMREGYSIQEIVIKGESQIEVRLAQLWRDNVRILYALSSVWPLDAKRLCRVEVGVEATYDFLHDVTCPMKKPFNSPYRTAVVKKYWHMLQDMSDTDQRLLQLHSFNTNVIHFTVPESIKQGVPLLIQAANSSTPELNSQFSSKDPAVMQFVSFWKHVLDISNWQKWLHTHRIGLILEHDIALAKHLHVPNSSGRFNVITCRQAQSALNFFLRDWCTFVLVENHLYVKLQYKDAEKPPTSFYVVHTAAKPPCIVLRLGFIGGTPCKDRNEELIILKEHLSQLNFPGQRGTQVEDKGSKTVLPVNQRKPSLEAIAGPPHPAQIGHKPPLQRLWSEIPCCKITRKPIEKMLIKYERMPLTFNFLDCPPAVDQSGHLTQALSADRLAYDNFTILSRYLFHHRWIWRVQSGSSSSSPPLLALGRILSNLAQIRLQEGFNFAHTHCGIVNLVAELRMEEDESSPDEEFKGQRPDVVPSILQYVIFPPHTTTAARDSVSEEDPEFMDAEHAEGELQIITECWVEPQSGVVSDNPPERSFLDGLHFSNIPQATDRCSLQWCFLRSHNQLLSSALKSNDGNKYSCGK